MQFKENRLFLDICNKHKQIKALYGKQKCRRKARESVNKED